MLGPLDRRLATVRRLLSPVPGCARAVGCGKPPVTGCESPVFLGLSQRLFQVREQVPGHALIRSGLVTGRIEQAAGNVGVLLGRQQPVLGPLIPGGGVPVAGSTGLVPPPRCLVAIIGSIVALIGSTRPGRLPAHPSHLTARHESMMTTGPHSHTIPPDPRLSLTATRAASGWPFQLSK